MIGKLIIFFLITQPEILSFKRYRSQVPFTFDFYKKPYLYVYSANGIFLQFKLDSSGITLKDSAGIRGVNGKIYYGIHSGKGVYLFSSGGIYYGGLKSFKKACEEASVVYSDTAKGKLYVLGVKNFYIISKGKVVRSFDLHGNNGGYFAIRNSKYAIIGGNGKLFKLDLTIGDIETIDEMTQKMTYHYYRLKKMLGLWYLKYHPFIQSPQYSIYYVGDEFTEITNKSHYVIMDSTGRIIKKLALTAIPLKIMKYKGFNVIVGEDFDFMQGSNYMVSTWIYLIDTTNLSVMDSFSYDHAPTSINRISGDFWVLTNFLGLLYLFKDLNFNRFANWFPWGHGMVILTGALKVDYDNDGDSDLVYIGITNTDMEKEEKVHSILIIRNNISEAEDFAIKTLHLAREKKNLIEAPRALNYVDMARSIFSVILPESLDTANRLRSRIYPLYRANIFITKTYKYSILVILFAIIAILYFKIQSLKDKVKPPPPGKFLEKMFAYPLFHKYTVRVAPMLESSFTPQFVEEVQKDSKDLHDYLVIPEVSNAFQNSNKFWRRLYRALKRNLRDIELFANIYFKKKRLRTFVEILLRRNLKNIGKLRE